MKRRDLMASLLVTAAYPALGRIASAATPDAPVLNAIGNRARFGVYLGAGCTGVERLGPYKKWLRRDMDQMMEFISWDMLEATSTWAISCWKKTGEESVVWSLPMLPQGKPKLTDGVDGRYDELFRNYAATLVRQGYGESIIRLGWEFNANWYTWDASKNPEAWIAYWRRIVSTMRNTPGSSFRFDWCMTADARDFPAERAYPGDDYVDIIGLDFYNMPLGSGDDSPEGRWNGRKNMRHGLKWQRDFALSHDKPISFPEWGTGVHLKWGGPPDDPYFIDQMAAWIADNRVEYHCYWEYKNRDFDSRLADGRQANAGAAFKRHFGGRGNA